MTRHNKKVAIIPARMKATRFPGKPLATILDLPLIEHVRRRVSLCNAFDEVYVATCDQQIMDAVNASGGKAIMTADSHERCTERVKEAANQIDCDIVAIFQGDEPIFDLDIAKKLVKPFEDEKVNCVGLLSAINDKNDLDDKNIVKAVIDHNCEALYFSRSGIPFFRSNTDCPMYRLSGLSAFRKDFLNLYSDLEPRPLEIIESVDLLRVLEHGYKVRGVIVRKPMYGVDEPQHVRIIENLINSSKDERIIYEKILQN